MRISLLFISVFVFLRTSYAQEKIPGSKSKTDTLGKALNEVVVTGQYLPQSLRNSVYQTRVVSAEQIHLRAATNIQQILSTELGFSFSNDLTLGTSDVQMMGMSGRNVKILLDGVPMIDRSDTRESLNQIDINTVERIEIVEGPLSVSYGTDALAGVINIITKKQGQAALAINARVQEETAGNEYSPFTTAGSHTQFLGITGQHNGWYTLGGLTHNEFNGFNVAPATATAVEIAADNNRWKPKGQWLANTKIGYGKENFNVWYRLDYLHETIDSKGSYNPNNYKAMNQKYVTNRYTQQLQGDYRFSEKLQISGLFAYANLKRTTQSVVHDYSNGTEELSTGVGEQDVSRFRSTAMRATLQYKMSQTLSFQPGIEINLDEASGARIKNSPAINDYAFFISSELNIIKSITIRPGLRFISNSIYNAPPVIPSLNTKVKLNKNFDLRLGYASGFRSPALRELYYDFFDASHSIMGNPNLKAEQSDSYTASLSFSEATTEEKFFRAVLNGFYNDFRNRIDYGLYAADNTITTLINIARYKTTGGTLENSLFLKNLQISLGFSWIGTYNNYVESIAQYGESKEFVWTPEINNNITYTFPKIGTTMNFAFKFSGKKSVYQLYTEDDIEKLWLAKTNAYSIADLMFTKRLLGSLTLNAGVKNLFDTTTLSSTSIATSGTHNTGSGPVPLNYGRSYVVGLNFNWQKK